MGCRERTLVPFSVIPCRAVFKEMDNKENYTMQGSHLAGQSANDMGHKERTAVFSSNDRPDSTLSAIHFGALVPCNVGCVSKLD